MGHSPWDQKESDTTEQAQEYSEGGPHISSISVTWEWLSNSDSQALFKQDPQVTHLMLKSAMHCSGAAHCQIDSSGEDQTGELLWE